MICKVKNKRNVCKVKQRIHEIHEPVFAVLLECCSPGQSDGEKKIYRSYFKWSLRIL